MPISLGRKLTPSTVAWNLSIDSTIMTVTGSMSIGAVMVLLVNHIGW